MPEIEFKPASPQCPASTSVCRQFVWGAVVLIFLLIYAPGLYRPALLDDADATHAEAAREMLARGDYITLHVNGVRYLEKAPLPYWLAALSYRTFGVSEFATRLPSVLAILLSVILASVWALHAFGRRAGVYAGLFVATSVGFYLFTRIFIPEALLSLCIGASLYFFLTALEARGKSPWRWYAGYVSVALAVLAKGLIGIVFVGLSAAGYLLWSREWRRWKEFRFAGGLGLFMLIAAPWHILAGIRNPGFFWLYFVNEHVLRFLGKRYPMDYNKLPALAYWGLTLVWLFPWSLFLALMFRRRGRGTSREANAKLPVSHQPYRNSEFSAGLSFRTRTRLLCWVWAGVVLLFFAFSTNQEYYTFPAYLPLLILLAGALSAEEEENPRSRWLLIPSVVYAVLGVTLGGVLMAGLWASRSKPFISDIGTVMADRNVGNNTLAMTHFFDLTTDSFAALRLPALLAAVSLIAGSLLALWLRARGKNFASTWAIACATGLLFLAAQLALIRFEPFLSSRPIAQVLARLAAPTDKVMIYGDQAYGSSLLFYLRRRIYLVNGRTTSMWFGSQFPDAPAIFVDDADLVRLWNGRDRVFLFVPPDQIARVKQVIPQPPYIVAQSSGKVVYVNRR
jgi:4-amino-4-deoxy-L-arabinose transferase-like glycosyltransferase